MPVSFRCEHCGRQVEAPPEAAGKRGKCPYCQQTNYIPLPPDQRDLIPLEELDEQEERRRQQELRRLREAEKELIADSGGDTVVPLEHRENLSAADLYHFAVNYCLDMAAGKLDRAPQHVEKLRKFGPLGIDAVGDIAAGKVNEPALKNIPPAVLKGFCKQLKEQLAAKK
jgi:hypothetical protein